jgi:hypothetical protein
MEDKKRFESTLIPRIKQDIKKFISSLADKELTNKDFNFFFGNIEEKDLVSLVALIRKHKSKIAKVVYGEKATTTSDEKETAIRGRQVNLEESLKPIIQKMLKEHYNY